MYEKGFLLGQVLQGNNFPIKFNHMVALRNKSHNELIILWRKHILCWITTNSTENVDDPVIGDTASTIMVTISSIVGATVLAVGSNNQVIGPPATSSFNGSTTDFGGLLEKFYSSYQTLKNIILKMIYM